jgi:hypothetical protein
MNFQVSSEFLDGTVVLMRLATRNATASRNSDET